MKGCVCVCVCVEELPVEVCVFKLVGERDVFVCERQSCV